MGLSTTPSRRRSYYEVYATDGQNHRIEQIASTHLVVGIDMAKEIHVAKATNFRGIVVSKRHLFFSNIIAGFEKLSRWITELPLSTDAVLFTDGGGKVKAQPQPLHGYIRISHSITAVLKKWHGSLICRIAMVNGLAGIVVYMDEKAWSVISFKVLDGYILDLYCVAN
jgi:hypothetical protein